MHEVAALFVQTGGAYFGLPGVDPWDEARDARKYLGTSPVVAHPPCSRWCKPLAKVNQTRYGHRIGDDGGCFEAALFCVLQFGGVLEHPANSYAWDDFQLLKPKRGSWQKDRSYWVTEVSQSAYGHPARKKTWLLYRGDSQPPALDWSDPKGTHLTSWLQRTSRIAPRLSKKEAIKTPPAFRDMLLSLACSSNCKARYHMSKAMDDVLTERMRQVNAEGWEPDYDDEHTDESLAAVAACYATPWFQRTFVVREFARDVGRSAGEAIIIHDRVSVPINWPPTWHGGAWKPKDMRRDLVRAAALILAEIERLDRASQSAKAGDG